MDSPVSTIEAYLYMGHFEQIVKQFLPEICHCCV